MVRLQSEPIHADALIARARTDADGAVALFLGTVRDHNVGRRVLHLEYQAYAPMAEREMATIEAEARRRFPVSDMALIHRTGRLEIGEISVAVAVATAHRHDAFEACRYVIDELKKRVPIWKKEFFEGGDVWIEGGPSGQS